jgi:UTP:GlnB (protein PII) uridylyltransferase
MKILIALLLFFALASPLPAQHSMTVEAQREINISRKIINDQRNTTLAYNMNFTKEEKEKFWPLYREYREAMGKVGDKRLAVIVEYADNIDSMTESMAKQLLDKSFAVEKETIKVKQQYVGKFRRILPQTKVVRLMQIESRMDAMVELKIAEGVPLMN